MTEHPCTPVGILEIAGRLGAKRLTAYKWRQRGLLPAPRWRVGGDPAWCWEHDIRPWAVQTRRLPVEEATT
jgi:hypothetical protein